MDDDRDQCCEEIRLIYRYVKYDKDEYKTYIKSMRHYLFDSKGGYVSELTRHDTSSQTLKLRKLPVGHYTVVTICNSDPANETLKGLKVGQSRLSDFLLKVASPEASGDPHHNTSALYWNTKELEVKAKERETYICDLSNIHCHLFVKVEWDVLPPSNGDYNMIIREVPLGYRLNPHLAYSHEKGTGPAITSDGLIGRVVKTFPSITGTKGEHTVTVPLYNLSLEGEFVTLRYTNDHIPIFQLYHSGRAVSKPIDLSKAFREWGWIPEKYDEQIFRIRLVIFEDGKVVVSQWNQAEVLDWINGGTFVN